MSRLNGLRSRKKIPQGRPHDSGLDTHLTDSGRFDIIETWYSTLESPTLEDTVHYEKAKQKDARRRERIASRKALEEAEQTSRLFRIYLMMNCSTRHLNHYLETLVGGRICRLQTDLQKAHESKRIGSLPQKDAEVCN